MNEIRDIHQPFMKYLKAQGLYFINHRSDQRSGIRSGHVDFTILHCGRALLIEAKAGKGKLSPKQVECIAHLRKNGNEVLVLRSVEECVAAVERWFGIVGAEKRAGGLPEPFGEGLDKSPGPIARVEGLTFCDGRSQHLDKILSVHVFAESQSSQEEPERSGRKVGEAQENNSKAAQTQGRDSRGAQNLWIANLRGFDYVFSGDSSPGGLATKLRPATAQDLFELPRK